MKSAEYDIGGMHGYLQLASADRHSVSSVAGFAGERFTVNAGDRWQPGGESSDDEKLSERAEFRSLTEDVVGDGKAYRYRFDLLIPLDYPEFSPKQTLGQWHEGGYPVAFVRYENGKLEFVTNYKSGLNYRVEIPHTKGKLLSLEFMFRWDAGEDMGGFYVEADGKMVASKPRHSLVETSSKSVYFKYGIYRSGMGAYAGPKPAPSQTVYYGSVSRTVVAAGFSIPAPVVTTPPLVPAIEAHATVPASTIYDRIGRAIVEIAAISTEVDKKYPSSSAMATQAADKLVKLSQQMRKADAKAGVGG